MVVAEATSPCGRSQGKSDVRLYKASPLATCSVRLTALQRVIITGLLFDVLSLSLIETFAAHEKQ